MTTRLGPSSLHSFSSNPQPAFFLSITGAVPSKYLRFSQQTPVQFSIRTTATKTLAGFRSKSCKVELLQIFRWSSGFNLFPLCHAPQIADGDTEYLIDLFYLFNLLQRRTYNIFQPNLKGNNSVN